MPDNCITVGDEPASFDDLMLHGALQWVRDNAQGLYADGKGPRDVVLVGGIDEKNPSVATYLAVDRTRFESMQKGLPTQMQHQLALLDGMSDHMTFVYDGNFRCGAVLLPFPAPAVCRLPSSCALES